MPGNRLELLFQSRAIEIVCKYLLEKILPSVSLSDEDRAVIAVVTGEE